MLSFKSSDVGLNIRIAKMAEKDHVLFYFGVRKDFIHVLKGGRTFHARFPVEKTFEDQIGKNLQEFEAGIDGKVIHPMGFCKKFINHIRMEDLKYFDFNTELENEPNQRLLGFEPDKDIISGSRYEISASVGEDYDISSHPSGDPDKILLKLKNGAQLQSGIFPGVTYAPIY